MTTLELQAKQKLYKKKLTISIKYAKLHNKVELEAQQRMVKELEKAERQVKQRQINKEKQAKNKVRAKEWKPLLKVKKPKPINHMTKADRYFSRCIRSMWAFQLSDWERYNTEYTGTTHHRLKDLTCWHYETRGIYSTRYHVGNCLPQTPWQNKAEHHNPSLKKIFRQKLVAKHWEHVVQEVEELAKARNRNENAKTDMKYEHEYWKTRYEESYKHMRE